MEDGEKYKMTNIIIYTADETLWVQLRQGKWSTQGM
jgi:hypothetical protein